MNRHANIRKKAEGYATYLLVLAVLAALLLLVPHTKEKPETVKTGAATPATLHGRQYYDQEPGEYCYVCTGSRSRKYHTTPTCPSSCRSRIRKITVAEARQKGYTFCRTCH